MKKELFLWLRVLFSGLIASTQIIFSELFRSTQLVLDSVNLVSLPLLKIANKTNKNSEEGL